MDRSTSLDLYSPAIRPGDVLFLRHRRTAGGRHTAPVTAVTTADDMFTFTFGDGKTHDAHVTAYFYVETAGRPAAGVEPLVLNCGRCGTWWRVGGPCPGCGESYRFLVYNIDEEGFEPEWLTAANERRRRTETEVLTATKRQWLRMDPALGNAVKDATTIEEAKAAVRALVHAAEQ